MFNGDELNDAIGVPFFYGVCTMFFVGIYCVGCWKAGWTKAPSDSSIWDVLFTSYEVLEAEMKELSEIEVSMSDSSDKSSEKLPEREENGVLTHYFSLVETKHTMPKIPSGQVSPTSSPVCIRSAVV
jgi:hypothetical protein